MTNTKNQPDQTFNGHPSWEHWSVALWLNDDGMIFRLTMGMIKTFGFDLTLDILVSRFEGKKTSDGVTISRDTLKYALIFMAETILITGMKGGAIK